MFDPARLVFIDETSTNTAMVRLRGRCPRGIRLIDHVPHGHWKTITFIAGLRRRAMVAPFVLDGPMNTISFMAYLKRCLVPTLKRGDIVMMDSLPVHKVAGVREVIEAAGARLRYLPKYSPDLNPIEQAFSKLKAHLRKAAERTIPRLSRRIGALMAKFSSQECDNYFRQDKDRGKKFMELFLSEPRNRCVFSKLRIPFWQVCLRPRGQGSNGVMAFWRNGA